MWERGEERKRKGLRGGGVGGGCRGGGVCCKLRNKFLSRVRTQPVLFLFIHPCKTWTKKNCQNSSWCVQGRLEMWQHTQQSTASPCRALDWQIDSSLLIQWIVMRGRSSLMESFVWLLPFLCVQRERKRDKRGRRNKKQEREREKSP